MRKQRVCRIPTCGEPLVMQRIPFCESCRFAIAYGAGVVVGIIVVGVIRWGFGQ